MPYELRGTAVVRSDTGRLVKRHPSREAALKHLRALKANVEEGSPGVLGVLLEGFDSAEHPRDFRGRFEAGDHVTLSHGMFGRVPAQVTKVTATRVFVTSSDPRVSDTSMTHNQAAVKLENMIGPNAVRPRLAKGQTANEMRGGIPMLGREGVAARGRGASTTTTEHADTRDKLANLPQGQSYGLHGPQGQIGRVERTSAGWRVVGPSEQHDRVHKTPSSAAGHAMRLQRSAAGDRRTADVMSRNYRGRQEVAAMNARQSQRAQAERERAAQVAARAGQGAGAPVFSSGRTITPAQRKRLSSVVSDITANAWQDRPYMSALISGALRDSGHVMGMTPGWMDRLHTNHASQLIKDLERLAKHGPGEMARESRTGGMLGSLIESFAMAPPTSGPLETPSQSQARGAQQVAAARSALASGWNPSKHPRARGGKFGYTTGGKRATRSSSARSHVVSEGAKGALVKSIQRQLGVAQDGVFGPNTRAAVVRFQKQHGLQVDGVIGRQTIAALRGDRHAASIRPGPIGTRTTRLKHPRAPAAKAARYQGGVLI